MEKSSLPAMIVYHGGSSSRWENVREGDVIQLPAFTSTTLAGEMQHFKEASWLTIHIPAGAKGIYMDELVPEHGDEVEVLLARNSKLRITSATKRDGVVYIGADLLL